jgi:hypothetical protein
LSDKIDPAFREWLLKEKLSFSITARFLVRFHVALILAGAVLAGWAANRLLYLAGVKDMLLRHPVAVVAAYAGFLLGLHAWIRYSGIRAYVNSRRAKELLEPEGFKSRPPPQPLDVNLTDALIAPEGCLLLIAVLFIWSVLFTLGGYLIVYAADLMAELVLELLLAAGLVRGIRRVDLLADFGIPKLSLWALAAVLGTSILLGLYAREVHPKATTIAELAREMMPAKRGR